MSDDLKNLFLNSKMGLQKVYNLLNQNGLDGVSSADLSNYSNLSLNDIPFAEYLKQTISGIDANSDDNISQEELNALFSKMKIEGLTYEQLFAMQTASAYGMGIDPAVISHILQNFSRIDVNHDGKVSQAELNLYKIKNEIAERNKNGPDTEKPSIYEEEPLLGKKLEATSYLEGILDI